MTSERKTNILNNMLEYLNNYGVDFEDIGIYDDTAEEFAYDVCLNYIVELLGCDINHLYFENVLGFTKEELIDEGMGWVYKQ